MKLIRKQKQKTALNCLGIAVAALCAGGGLAAEETKEKAVALEEVVVTAQKREQSLQDTPIAISVLNAEQLEQQGVSSLGDLADGLVPSLRILPTPNTPSTLIMTIRGNGPGEGGQSTRDGSVAVYLDEFYLGRAQSLDMELTDLERIEVLRGPQGTLFGRNATGGAISLVSKRPTGKFGLTQTLQAGSYNQHGSITHINLPEWNGLRTKIDYLFSERDGWVDNTAATEADYNAYKKRGARLSMDWRASDALALNYFYSDTHTDMTQNYYQLYQDDIGIIGSEPERQTTTRFPIFPLEPTNSDQKQHGLTLNWTISDWLTVQSLSSYRELDDKTRNNFGGALYYDGIIEEVDLQQEQFSQEFRFLGNREHLQWVAGIYYYTENTDEALRNFFSIDIFGNPALTGTPFTLIDPPIEVVPERIITAELTSQAIYGQVTWKPPVLSDDLSIILGLRHSREKRAGIRPTGFFSSFNLETDQTDPMITLEYQVNDNMLTYAKWSNAYRSGGVNSRSIDLTPFNQEEVELFELGLKAEGWDRRVRLNTALFTTNYQDMFIDVQDPANLEFTETINATNKVKVDGVELELTVKAIRGLTVGLNYTYLDGDIPLQPNPHNNGQLEAFNLTQTPKHAGALSLNYIFPALSIGTVTGQLDIVSSDRYHHWPSGEPAHLDAYTLVNTRFTLSDISLGSGNGTLKSSLWVKNLTNEEYAVFSFNLGVAITNAYNDPRTVGIDITYQY